MSSQKIISVVKAEYLSNYSLQITFDDGKEIVVDFAEFILASQNPMISKYSDLELFKSFSIIYGDIVWNDYELCFPVWDIYSGTIFHKNKDTSESAA